MVIIFINVYWCPSRFPYQMILVSSNSNTMGVTIIAGTVCPSRAPEFIPVFLWGRVAKILFFTLSVLRFMALFFFAPLVSSNFSQGRLCIWLVPLWDGRVVLHHGEIGSYFHVYGVSGNFMVGTMTSGIYGSQMTTDMFTYLYRTLGTLTFIQNSWYSRVDETAR